MAGDSGTSGQLVALPTGGGALRGIGETFAPDLHTGTGNLSVPIALPPGRNGLRPEVSLGYSTGSGNGPFGLGWSLAVPGITRKTSRGVPRYQADDVFVYSGGEDLVPVGGARYRPRTESAFARIVHHTADGEDLWEIAGKDGRVSRYTATIGKPGRPSDIFAWRLTQTVDPFGNLIEYAYRRDSGIDGPHVWDQLYVDQIRYGIASVTFEYEERPDPFSDYRAGFEIRTRLRCTAIHVRVHPGTDVPVKSYRLAYEEAANGASLLQRVQVVGYDDQGAAHDDLAPPLEFGYTAFTPEDRSFAPVDESTLPARSLADPQLRLADLFGRGLPDLLELNGSARYWRNLGNGRFDPPRPIHDLPAGISLSKPGVQLLDADGDGRIDLLATQNGLAGYFPLDLGGGPRRRAFHRYAYAPTIPLDDPEVELVDIDGDGVVDAVRSGSRIEVYLNDPRKGFDPARTRFITRRDAPDFPDVSFADNRVRWADMTGDGLQDVVLVHDGNIEYWPSLGHGDFGARVHMRGSPNLPPAYDPARLLLGDVDGDGVADLVYVDDDRTLVWINRSGNVWSGPVEVTGTPPGIPAAVRLEDLLGSGTRGVVWSAEATTPGRPHLHFLDLTGGTKPYLLHQIDNRLGAVTTVDYAPSTVHYLADQAKADTRWRAGLPFPVHVVTKVSTVDALAGTRLTREYRYHHGCLDGGEREFRGFGLVDEIDTETRVDGGHDERFCPPLMTRSWFHLGPVGEEFGEWDECWAAGALPQAWRADAALFPGTQQGFLAGLPRRVRRDAVRALRGQPLRTEVYALDGSDRAGRPYSVTEATWVVAEVVDSADGHTLSWAPRTDDRGDRPGSGSPPRVFVPLRTMERTTRWDRGDDPLTRFTFTDRFDDYGQAGRQTSIACPRGWRTLADRPVPPYLVTRIRTSYATSQQVFCADRVATVTNWEVSGSAGLTVTEIRDLADDDGRLIPVGQSLNYYDGPAWVGLPLGEVGAYGAMTRSERLVLTPALAASAYGAAAPPYLSGAAWPAEYPAAFRNAVNPGYLYRDDDDHIEGWYAQERCRYDFHDDPATAGGLLLARRDPAGKETTAEFDPYHLLPSRLGVVLAPGRELSATVDYNYRTMQPGRVVDENDNVCDFGYTPLGLLETTWAKGRDDAGHPEGDRLVPHTVYQYDLTAFHRTGSPAFVRTLRRVHHDTSVSVPAAERDRVIETREYSDGFGRLLQTRSEDAPVRFTGTVGVENASATRPNVVVRDCHVYDNKGNVVERYEPFFAEGWDWAQPDVDQVRTSLRYDPHGQVIRTLHPDGSQQWVVNGVPADLTRADAFAPTPWETYTYDANDLAPLSDSTRVAPPEHHFTPKSVVTDALGRVVRSVERDGTDEVATTFAYDIRGNLVEAVDPLGRTAIRCTYDLAGQRLRTVSPDAGERRTVYDAAGHVLESRELTGALTLRGYDWVGRLTRLWARDNDSEPTTLRERRVYGDEPGQAVPNARGRLTRHDDEAGSLAYLGYDFAGRPTGRQRRAFRDDVVLAVFDPAPAAWAVTPFRPDWDTHTNADLDPPLAVEWEYDALGRTTLMRYPQDVEGQRRTLRQKHDEASRITGLEVDGDTYVDRIGYGPRGQRVLVAYGNAVLTWHTWDPRSFLLVATRTEECTPTGPHSWQGNGTPWQDTGYGYDLAGNLTGLVERSPGSGVAPSPDLLDREFTYDALYRLRSATGREADTRGYDPPWLDGPVADDPTATRAYRESYTYDAANNLVELKHTRFTRQLDQMDVTYDASGNLVAEGDSRHCEWDHAGRLRVYRTQTMGAEPSVHATYLYDSSGQRVKKVVRHNGGTFESTVNVDGVFELHTRVRQGTSTNNTLHLLDGTRPVARIRVGQPFPDDGAADASVTYLFSDHLGSAELVVGGADAGSHDFVRREEFTPYGETAFGGYGRKRYRFSGKERDEESGLVYHGARYYAPWQARWVSCDPTLAFEDLNRYRYGRSSPMVFRDDNGRYAEAGFLAAPGVSGTGSAAGTGAAVGTGAAAGTGGAAGGGAAAGGSGGAVATGGLGATLGISIGVAVGVLVALAAFVAFYAKVGQRGGDLAEQRVQRTNLAHNLVDQGLISWEEANEYIITGHLFIPKDGPRTQQDAYRQRWFQLGRQFQQHVLETKLKALHETGRLHVEERIGTKTGLREPDFAAIDPDVPGAYKWIGDAKLGRIELDDQMRGFIDEASRTTLKRLLLFVPEGTTVPDAVLKEAEKHGVKIFVIEVPWQPDYIPKESAGRAVQLKSVPPPQDKKTK